MEPSRVELQNWPADRGAGGWVAPAGEPLQRWVVKRVHARYVAPAVPFGATDGKGRPLRKRGEYHAYLVDLSGDDWGLPDYERVLVHQAPPVGMWWIKMPDDEHLARMEKYRVD
ncbi:hypothetical protein [Nonomuraea sp. 10N515B]|uniref:hypothetical protein n=1 Tax=Nonomuraea sp. 10N515B TaxID=3457422 RepID=UPI003FCDB659